MIVMGENKVVAWCLVQNYNIVMKVKGGTTTTTNSVRYVCVYVCEYLDLKQGRLPQGKVHVKYATNESSTTFKLTSYLLRLLGLATTMYLLGGDRSACKVQCSTYVLAPKPFLCRMVYVHRI